MEKHSNEKPGSTEKIVISGCLITPKSIHTSEKNTEVAKFLNKEYRREKSIKRRKSKEGRVQPNDGGVKREMKGEGKYVTRDPMQALDTEEENIKERKWRIFHRLSFSFATTKEAAQRQK